MTGRKINRDRAIEAILAGLPDSKVAIRAGCSPRTLHRWRQEPDFRRQLDRARQELFDRNIASLSELTGVGIRRLREILTDDQAPRRDWLRATEIVLREARNCEAASIRERLEEIERALDESDLR